MSKHAQKYPGLYAAAKANGIEYHTLLQRVKKGGMSLADAISRPVRRGRPRKAPLPVPPSPSRFVPSPVRKITLVPRVPCVPHVPKPRKRYIRSREDKSPLHIRKLREAYCDEFIKTGEINRELLTKLKQYADGVRHAQASVSTSDHSADAPVINGQSREPARRGAAHLEGAWPHLSEQ